MLVHFKCYEVFLDGVVGRETRSRAKTRVVRGGVYEVARGKW